jgi:hypothetical protein
MISRISVASISTLTPRPSASILITTASEARKEKNTLIMISAAEVITRAVTARPDATLSWLSLVASHTSRTRDSRNTS